MGVRNCSNYMYVHTWRTTYYLLDENFSELCRVRRIDIMLHTETTYSTDIVRSTIFILHPSALPPPFLEKKKKIIIIIIINRNSGLFRSTLISMYRVKLQVRLYRCTGK